MKHEDTRNMPWPPPPTQFNLGATIHLTSLEGRVVEVLPNHNYRVEFYRYWRANKLHDLDSPFVKLIHFDDLNLYDWSSDLGFSADGTYIKWSEYFGD